MRREEKARKREEEVAEKRESGYSVRCFRERSGIERVSLKIAVESLKVGEDKLSCGASVSVCR